MRDRKLNSIRRIDAQSTARPALISYNPGTMTDPLPAVERAMAAFRRSMRGNPIGAYDNCRAVLEDLRAVASEVLGGRPHEWAHADAHTATIDRIASTLAQFLAHADRSPITVVSTPSEHVGGLGAFLADPRFDVRVVEPTELPHTAADLYFLSHLTYDTNRDLTAEIRQVAATRPAGSVLVVDGTQAVGQIDVDVASLGCDAYLTSAHKWLGGPHGSGLLYLREAVIEQWPTPFRAGAPLCPELPIGRWEPRGGQDFARVAGIAAALRAYQCHAKPGSALRLRVIEALEGSFRGELQVLRSSSPRGRVVVFTLQGRDVYPVYRRLFERGISVKCIKRDAPCSEAGQTSLGVLRVGFPWWADARDVERAVEVLVTTMREEFRRETLAREAEHDVPRTIAGSPGLVDVPPDPTQAEPMATEPLTTDALLLESLAPTAPVSRTA